jgi:hypothetical protein
MKALFNTLLLILFMANFCNAQFSQTIHRTYVLEANINQVKLNLNSTNIQYRETKGSRVMVEMLISADVPNEAMMNFLIENGRYELNSQNDMTSSTLTLSSVKPANVIVVKGKECKEEVSYIVYLPSTVKFINADKSSSNKD